MKTGLLVNSETSDHEFESALCHNCPIKFNKLGLIDIPYTPLANPSTCLARRKIHGFVYALLLHIVLG